MDDTKTEVAAGYEAIADWFDKNRDKTLFERAYLSNILARMPENGSLLDLGCGTGEPIAKFFIENNIRVTGIDIAPGMIALCRERFPLHTWHTGDMRALNLGKTFDAILAWDSFFHLTQAAQKEMFKVFSSHAAPHALLAFNTGPNDSTVYGTMQGIAFHHASLSPEDYQQLFKTHGFQVITHVSEDAHCGGRTVWIAQKT